MISIPIQVKTLQLWIPGRVIPKARPRFHEGHITLPQNYRGWKNTAYLDIISQLAERTSVELPIKKAAVAIQFIGCHRGDLDNLAGAVLDLLTETKVIIDDRVSCVSRLLVEHEPVGERGALIEVKALL